MATTNLAGRAGRWSAAHWKTAAFGWIAFGVLIVFVSGARRRARDGALGDRKRRVPAGRADPRRGQLRDSGARERADPVGVGDVRASIVLVRGRERRPGTVPAAERHEHRLPGRAARRRPGVRDQHSVLVQFEVKGDAEDAEGKIAPILAAIDDVQSGNPSLIIEEFGQASADHELSDALRAGPDARGADVASADDRDPRRRLRLARRRGSARPARLLRRARRHRREHAGEPRRPDGAADPERDHPDDRDGGRDRLLAVLPPARARGASGAVRRTRRCSRRRARPGRPCSSPERTVLIAMAGMFVSGNSFFSTIGLGTMIVVLAAMIGSLTVLPALLHRLGDRVELGRIPFFRSRHARRRRMGPLHRSGPAPSRSSRCSSPAACSSSSRSRRSACTRSCRTSPICPTTSRSCGRTSASSRPSPARRHPRWWSSRLLVDTPEMRRAYELFRQRRGDGRAPRAFHRHRQPRPDGGPDRLRVAGNGDNAASLDALQTLRDDGDPSDREDAARCGGGGHRRDRGHP